LPAGLDLRSANPILSAGLGLRSARTINLPAGLGLRSADSFTLPAGLDLHASNFSLPAGLGLRTANFPLQPDLGLHAASWNSNKTFKLVFASVKNKYSKGLSFTHLPAPITFHDGSSQLIVVTASVNTKNIKIPFAAFD
jgi:hypothetical protein